MVVGSNKGSQPQGRQRHISCNCIVIFVIITFITILILIINIVIIITVIIIMNIIMWGVTRGPSLRVSGATSDITALSSLSSSPVMLSPLISTSFLYNHHQKHHITRLMGTCTTAFMLYLLGFSVGSQMRRSNSKVT